MNGFLQMDVLFANAHVERALPSGGQGIIIIRRTPEYADGMFR